MSPKISFIKINTFTDSIIPYGPCDNIFYNLRGTYVYSENRYLLNTHISYDKLLLTRKLLDLRLI